MKQYDQMAKRPKLYKYLDDEVLENVQRIYGVLYQPEPRRRTRTDSDGMMSFEDIGAELGVSKQRAQQILQEALRKCQCHLMSKYPKISLDDFLGQDR